MMRKPRLQTLCGSLEALWIINVDANLSPNSKLKIPLNNE